MQNTNYYLILFTLLLITNLVLGQSINHAEYYIDTDPGLGQGVPVSISQPSEDINLTFSADLADLIPGYHTLYLRSRDSSGRWSVSYAHPFYLPDNISIPDPEDVVYLEYFIDKDPGLGIATPVSLGQGGIDLETSFAIPLVGIAPGFHTLYLRSSDAAGQWSINYAYTFYIAEAGLLPDPPDLVYLEYFINRDPGQGQGIPVSFSQSEDINTNFAVSLTNLPPGFHTLYLRSRDLNGSWSTNFAHPFYIPDTDTIPNPAEISYLEYFIDEDPGLKQGIAIAVIPGQDVTANAAIPLAAVPPGFHTLYLRSKNINDQWTVNMAHPFYIADTATIPDPDNIVMLEYFIDSDPGLGNGSAIAIASAQDVNAAFAIDLQMISEGFHTLYIRSQDHSGQWTLSQAHPFFIHAQPLPEPADINSIEYFFAAGDFRSSSRFYTGFTPGKDINASFPADLSGLVLDSTYTMRLIGRDVANVRSIAAFSTDSLIQPVLRLSDSWLHFDSLAVGDSSSATIYLYANKDSANIQNFIFHDGTNYSLSKAVELPYLLFPDDSIAIDVWYRPLTSGNHPDSIDIISDAPDAPLLLVLSGKAYIVNTLPLALHKGVPATLTLSANYPNPFNPSTTIAFGLPTSSHARLAIFNILGEKVGQLIDAEYDAGYHQVSWDGRNQSGKAVSSGVYIYRLESTAGTISRRMLLIR